MKHQGQARSNHNIGQKGIILAEPSISNLFNPETFSTADGGQCGRLRI